MWRQLRELCGAAFPDLPMEDVLAELCATLLRCAWDVSSCISRQTQDDGDDTRYFGVHSPYIYLPCALLFTNWGRACPSDMILPFADLHLKATTV